MVTKRRYVFSKKMPILCQEYNQTLFKSIFWGKMKRGVFQFWDQNHGLTPL